MINDPRFNLSQLDLEVASQVLTKIDSTYDMPWNKRNKTSLTSWLLNIGAEQAFPGHPSFYQLPLIIDQ